MLSPRILFDKLLKNHPDRNSLDKILLKQGKDRWLDLGCGGNFSSGFYYLDYYSNVEVPEEIKHKYFKINILELTETQINKIGTFDLIRMQHVFEHFTPEEGKIVLDNCARLLNSNGCILITVPDLKLFIKYYKNNSFIKLYTFYHWALNRIEKNAPKSFYFSIFTHSLVTEQHKWCYDFEGLKYQVEFSKKFKNIQQLKLSNKLSSIPFTHNRPKEDLCLIAYKKEV